MRRRSVVWLAVASAVAGAAASVAQDQGDGQDQSATAAAAEAESTLRSWRDTIQFGIDDEVLTLIGELDRNRETSLNAELIELAGASANPDVVRVLLEMFRSLEDDSLAAVAHGIVEREGEAIQAGAAAREGRPRSLLTASIYYLGDVGETDSAELMLPLIDHDDALVATAAIAAVGESGDGSHVEGLLARIDDLAFPAELKPELLLALGTIRAEGAVERLEGVVADTANPRVWRMYASDALGKIGSNSSLPVLRELLSEDDAQLRAYAASAIGAFDSADASTALIGGLRDGHWRVREASARGLGRPSASDAIPILRYKAERDPEERVRLAAIDALARIGNAETRTYLQQTAGEDAQPVTARVHAVSSLIKHDLEGSLPFLKELLDAEWSRSPPTLLVAIARELAGNAQPSLKPLFERFLASAHPGVRVYGVRGAARGGIRGMRSAIETLRASDGVAAVRLEAELALQRIGQAPASP